MRCSTAARSQAVRFKVDLPNYGVFDEKRVFEPGPLPGPVCSAACASASRSARTSGADDVVECLAETGAEILLVPNGSPYWRGKTDERLNIAVARVDGERPAARLPQPDRRPGRARLRRRLLRARCGLLARLPAAGLPRGGRADGLGEAARRAGAASTAPARSSRRATRRITPPACWACATMSSKNRFPGVVLGLSGGIDSALCAAMAVDALGPGARPLRDAALPLSPRTSRSTMRPPAPRRSACATTSCRSPRPSRGSRRRCSRCSRDAAARHHRGEHPEPRPRHDPDVDLEQVRADGGHDRQQVRDVGRLRHALRRHERRLQPDQGPLQDGGLPPLGPAQPLEARRRARTGRAS